MLYNIGYTNTAVIYRHSTIITKVMLLYNTEWQYDQGMAVNYRSKMFNNIGTWLCWARNELNFAGGSSLPPSCRRFKNGVENGVGAGVEGNVPNNLPPFLQSKLSEHFSPWITLKSKAECLLKQAFSA